MAGFMWPVNERIPIREFTCHIWFRAKRSFVYTKPFYGDNTMKLPKAYATSVRKRAIDLTLSVNPLGCSPRAASAVKRMSMSAISAYPDPTPLIESLAKAFRFGKQGILLGNGSEQLIKLVSQAFLTPGDLAMVEAGSFFLFSKEPALAGGTVKFFDFTAPRRSKIRPALLFIANPTTPGGINRTNAAIREVIDLINPRVAVVDEANGEFRDETMISEIQNRKNIIVLRTFSKVFGLASLRIGMAFGKPKLIEKMSEFLQPFPVTSVGLAAAAAALADTEFIERTKRFVSRERAVLTRELTARGFTVSPSVTNNLFVSRPDNARIIRGLARRNVSVIDGAFFPGNSSPGFRISLKDRKTNRAFLRILDEVLIRL